MHIKQQLVNSIKNAKNKLTQFSPFPIKQMHYIKELQINNKKDTIQLMSLIVLTAIMLHLKQKKMATLLSLVTFYTITKNLSRLIILKTRTQSKQKIALGSLVRIKKIQADFITEEFISIINTFRVKNINNNSRYFVSANQLNNKSTLNK